MTNETKLVALPAYLLRRLQAFRVSRDDKVTYLLRDKIAGKTYDIEQWQFFLLEVLPGCETIGKLLSVFSDRFGREIEERDVLGFFAHLADSKLLSGDASKHALLEPFTRSGYALEKGLIKPKSFEEIAQAFAAKGGKPEGESIADSAPAAPVKTEEKPTPAVAAEALPAGINEADSLDPGLSKLLVSLFPMQPVASRVLPLVEPLKYGIYLIPFLAFAAVMIFARFGNLALEDLNSLREATTLATHALFSLLTINLAVTVVQSLIGQKYRAALGSFGIGLRFGFFPRFMVPIEHATQLSRRERMWLHAGPLLTRVLLFSVGVLVWYNLRDSHMILAKAGLGLAFLCGVNLVLDGANPLVKGNGYHLLSAFMNEPFLRGKAYKAFMDRIKGGASTEAGTLLLTTYALASFVFAYVVVLLIVAIAGHFLIYEMRLGGAALVVVVVLGLYMSVRTFQRFQKIDTAYQRSVQFDRWRKRTLPAEAGETVQVERSGSSTSVYFQRALLLSLLLLLFLPYEYDAGGEFEVFPGDRQILTSDIAGIIEEVNFDGGERVQAGTVIARLRTTDLAAQRAVLDAQVAQQEATIADLKARPRKEEVMLAQRELETAQERARFSAERVPRYERLYRDRTISFDELDGVRKEAEVDAREVAQRGAALDLARAGTPPDRIAAEQAQLTALLEQRREIDGKVERTVLRMPFEGNILSTRLKQRLNSMLEKGAPFATVESLAAVTLEIEVPESDISYVKIGAPVRARPNALYDQTFEGKVQSIDRNVTNKSFGKVLKVVAVVDDPSGDLKTGMTGYAKVSAGSVPAWKAFSTALVRFVTVQVWSWVP